MQTDFLAIGLMSGTSLDGVDAALIRTDGEQVSERLGFLSNPYPNDLKSDLRELLKTKEASKPELVEQVEKQLTLFHAALTKQLLSQAGIDKGEIYIVGFHGQTINHDPDNAYTWQIGDGPLLAHELGIDVVYDFRSNDMLHGGQGAPLVPLYHDALMNGVQSDKNESITAVLNIGGVANITYLDGDNIIACDTGPGNALIDDWVFRHTGEAFDANGALAKQGKVNPLLLDTALSHDFFSESAPKSVDRDMFASVLTQDMSVFDGAATLTELTVKSIVKAQDILPQTVDQWWVTGGGGHNAFLMERLSHELSGDVSLISELKIEGEALNPDAIEAEAFAYLAVRSCQGKALSLATTTGLKTSSATGGVFCPA